MVEPFTFHGRAFHLSWSSLSPLDFKKPENTSFADRRYQEGYQESYQESYQVYLSRAKSPLLGRTDGRTKHKEMMIFSFLKERYC